MTVAAQPPPVRTRRRPSSHVPLGLPTLICIAALATACRSQPEFDGGARAAPVAAPGSSVRGERAQNSAGVAPQKEASAGAPYSYADIVSRVAPAVVTIHSARRVRAPKQFPFFDDPFLREFFGGGSQRGAPRPGAPDDRGGLARGLGSGVLVTAEGYCLTNHHVIDGAEEITLELTDRRTFQAEIVGSDPPSDLAVVKVTARDLPILNLGDSERVRVGDVALAIGNPLGVGQTVTAGIISAKGRFTGLSDGSFEDFLQTDAPINQGNSGGALVNAQGELVGINSQILSTSGGNIGIGFAIPSNMARNVMQQLISSGRVQRGQLGIIVEPLTPETAKKAGRADARGVLVREVVPGGPAEAAGVKPGDVIMAIDGTPIDDTNALRIKIAGSQPGTAVTLTVWRDGREQQLSATLVELRPTTPRT